MNTKMKVISTNIIELANSTINSLELNEMAVELKGDWVVDECMADWYVNFNVYCKSSKHDNESFKCRAHVKIEEGKVTSYFLTEYVTGMQLSSNMILDENNILWGIDAEFILDEFYVGVFDRKVYENVIDANNSGAFYKTGECYTLGRDEAYTVMNCVATTNECQGTSTSVVYGIKSSYRE